MTDKRAKINSGHGTPGVTAWFSADASLAFLAMYSAYAFSPDFYVLSQTGRVPHFGQVGASALFCLLIAGTSQIFALHDPLQSRQFWPMLILCLGSAGMLAIVALALLVRLPLCQPMANELFRKLGRLVIVAAKLGAGQLRSFTEAPRSGRR